MFESKINRGRANGYAPLDGSGKVPLDKLPPIQSTIDTGSFATTGSNTFTGTQTISDVYDTSLTIGELNFIGGPSFGLRVSGSDGAPLFLTSDVTSLIGAITNPTSISDDASFFANQLISFPISDGPTAGILVQKSGSFQSNWVFDYDGKSYFPSDINIGYNSLGSGLTSGSLNVNNGNINVNGSTTITGSNGRLIYRGTALEVNPTLAEIHVNNDTPWLERFHNDTFSTSSAVMAYFAWNDGRFVFHNESTQSIGLQVNGFDAENGLLVYSDKVAFVNNVEISDSLNVNNGNINVSGSVNISSSLVVSSTFVNNGTIDALNSDLIIDGGYLILTGSVAPVSVSGSVGDIDGMVVFDSNFLYYCTTDYTLPITGSNPIFQITGSGTTHIYDIWEGEGWNGYHDPGVPRIQTGPSQEDGGTLMPEVGWYMVDDLGSIKEIISSDFGFPIGTLPAENGIGFLFELDTDYVYSNANTTLTFYETIPTVNIITQAVPAVDGSGEIWTKTKLDKGPNYAPFGSGSWESQAIGEVTELDITKDIHLLDTSGNNNLYNWYLPDGLYDGHIVRFALKGDGDTNPSYVKLWMNNIRTDNGTIVSSTTWHPFYDDGSGSSRSLATALYIDGAWNIDTDYWDM